MTSEDHYLFEVEDGVAVVLRRGQGDGPVDQQLGVRRRPFEGGGLDRVGALQFAGEQPSLAGLDEGDQAEAALALDRHPVGQVVGDLFVLLGSLESRRELSAIALIAMVVAASYLLWVQRRLFLGPVDEPANRGLIDLDRVERAILLALTIPIVWIGVYPNPVLRRI